MRLSFIFLLISAGVAAAKPHTGHKHHGGGLQQCKDYKFDMHTALASDQNVSVLAGKIPETTPTIAVDHWYQVKLFQESNTRFATKPEKKFPGQNFGGLLTFEAPRTGTYYLASKTRLWIDIVRDAKKTKSVGHDMREQCQKISKVVAFHLQKGRHLLQLSSNSTELAMIYLKSL